MDKLSCYFLLLLSFFCFRLDLSWSLETRFNRAPNNQGSSDLANLVYHMGPVLSSPIKLYIIWLYTDQTGSNITDSLSLSGEFFDSRLSNGVRLNRLSMQHIIKNAVTSKPSPLPLDPRSGLYLVLTSSDVQVDEFCRAVCGFHYFSFPSIVGATVPYAWIGYSGTQCPGVCAYPFARPLGAPPPSAMGGNDIMRPPNGDAGVDGMISVIAHELAESSSNPLVNAWYAGDNPIAPGEIADMCLGLYGSGGGGGYVGKVSTDAGGNGYNVNGVKGRRFLVQWVWDPEKKRCFGPNAMD
ncbi:hypothetical protein GOBAR_DD16475 [Gossypium barbadense]|nr:hypothetical protein GOBAR_DD16475 [Gossypium barbadense]